MKKIIISVLMVTIQLSFAQASLFDRFLEPKKFNSFKECANHIVAKARLIERDLVINACSKYQKTVVDRCEIFRSSDGKYGQMLSCRGDLKENEVIVNQTEKAVDVCEYMNCNCFENRCWNVYGNFKNIFSRMPRGI